jgi:diguanylate cyclase (GGDEF)-like protein/PAS domain S-box-containing protein
MSLTIASYAQFLETLPDAMLLVNSSGRIILANSQVSILLGYEPGELLGSPVQLLVPEAHRAEHESLMEEFLSRPRRRLMGTVMKLHARRKDGSECPVDIMLSPIVIDGAQFVVCAVRDTTQIRYMQDALNAAYEHEKLLARIDPLTGAANQRSFDELAQREIERAHRYRYPFTLGYFDLDDFKAINDEFGHKAGDEILKALVRYADANLRKTDLFARLGGDEFAFILVDTGPELARTIISRFQEESELQIPGNGRHVTFSIGALTCMDASLSLEKVMEMVDNLMYVAKRDGKAGAKYAVHGA